MSMPHESNEMADLEGEQRRTDIDKRQEEILEHKYKDVQCMASERKLPANLKKTDMARLIALHDTGAEAELNYLLSDLKEIRSRMRQSQKASSSPFRGYVTAEADSANLDFDEDDDDELNPHMAEDEGDDDYEPMVKPKKLKKAGSGKQHARHYAGSPSVAPGMHPAAPPSSVMGPGGLSPALHASDGHPSGGHPSGSHPSGGHPSGSHPSGGHPSGSYPSGSYPSGGHPSGSYPSGSYPSGGHPYGGHGVRSHTPGVHAAAASGPSGGHVQGGLSAPGAACHPLGSYSSGDQGPAGGHVQGGGRTPGGFPGGRVPGMEEPVAVLAPPSKARKPASRRTPSTNRVSKTGRVIKNRHDASYVYSKIAVPNNPYPTLPALAPLGGFRHSLPMNGNSYECTRSTSNYRPSASSYGHQSTPLPSLHPTCVSISNPNLAYNTSYQINQPPEETEFPYNSSVNNLNTSNGTLLTFNMNSTLPEAQPESSYALSPALLNFDSLPALFPQSGKFAHNNMMGSEVMPSHQVVKPISLPAIPTNDAPPSGYISPNLEWLFNVKSDNLSMPLQLSPYWKPANTNSVNSYNTPITFSSCGPGLYQESSHIPVKSLYPNMHRDVSAFHPFGKTPHKVIYDINLNSNYDVNRNIMPPSNGPSKQFIPESHPYARGTNEMGQQNAAPPLLHNRSPQIQSTVLNSHPEQYTFAGSGTAVSTDPHYDQQAWQRQQIISKKQMQQQLHHKQLMAQQKRRQHQHQSQSQLLKSGRQSSFPGQDRRLNSHPSVTHQSYKVMYLKSQQLIQQPEPPNYQTNPVPSQSSHLSSDQHHPQYHQETQYQNPLTQQPSVVVHHRQGQGPPLKKTCLQPNQTFRPQEPNTQADSSYEFPLVEQCLKKSSWSDVQQSHQTDVPQLSIPEFRGQNQELSYPLIFDFLTDAEKQLSAQNKLESDVTDTLKYDNAAYATGESRVSQSTGDGRSVSPSIEEILPFVSEHVMNSRLQDFSLVPEIVSEAVVTSTIQSHLSPTSPMVVHSPQDEHKTALPQQSCELLQVPHGSNDTSVVASVANFQSENVTSNFLEPESILPDIIEPREVASSLEKVVQEDESAKQVVFLCSDGAGDFDYMTLSVSQGDGLDSSVGTLPATPSTSDVVVNDDRIHGESVEDGLVSSDSNSSHPSQVSTIPVTNSDLSTESLSTISDYLSTRTTLCTGPENGDLRCIELVTNTNDSDAVPDNVMSEEDGKANNGMFLEALSSSAVSQAESIQTESMQPEFQKTSCSELMEVDLPPSSLEMQPMNVDTTQENSEQDSTPSTVPSKCEITEKSINSNLVDCNNNSGTSLGTQQDIVNTEGEEKDCDNNVQECQKSLEPMDPLKLPDEGVRIILATASSPDEPLNLAQIDNDQVDCGPCIPSSGGMNAGEDINMNVASQSSSECCMQYDHVPLLRSKLAGNTYPGKQARQPIRSSPRTSDRPRPSYLQPSLPSPRSESALQQPAKGRKPCPNADHGCMLILPPAQLSSHFLVCEYKFIECPAIGCGWECIAKKLCSHIRESHRGEIGSGSDSTHTVSIHEIRQQQRLTFLREVSRKLFVVCIHAFGNSIFASIQFIAPSRGEKPISATGIVEFNDFASNPHAWRGKIGPIQQPLDTIRNSGNCLEVSSEFLGSNTILDTTITLHTNIRLNPSPQSQSQSASVSDPLA